MGRLSIVCFTLAIHLICLVGPSKLYQNAVNSTFLESISIGISFGCQKEVG